MSFLAKVNNELKNARVWQSCVFPVLQHRQLLPITELAPDAPELAVDCQLLVSSLPTSKARTRTFSHALRLDPSSDHSIERFAPRRDRDDLLATRRALGSGDEVLRADLQGRRVSVSRRGRERG